jgi:tRNA A37 threonylcarbamoyladenosine dehydratase
MNLQKEQKEIDQLCEGITDIHINDLLEGKNNPFSVAVTLRTDLMKNHPKVADTWDAVYSRQPSCKDVFIQNYDEEMRKKYIRVYKICLGVIKE